MKMGCCTSGLERYMRLLEAVDEIGQRGFDFAEINTDGDIDEGEQEMVERRCLKYGMFLHLHVNLNAICAEAQMRQKEFSLYFAEKFFKLNRQFNNIIRQISFDPVYNFLTRKGILKRQMFPLWIRGITRMLEKAVKILPMRVKFGKFNRDRTTQALNTALKISDAEICLENLGSGTTAYGEIANILTRLEKRERFGMLIDIGHLNISVKNVYEYIGNFPFRIAGFHFSNNDGRRDSHGALNDGSVDYVELVNVLKNINYKGTVSLEIISPSLEGCRRDIAGAFKFLKRCM